MKNIKYLLGTILFAFTLPALAFTPIGKNDVTKYCPNPKSLSFTTVNNGRYSAGVIKGSINNVVFLSDTAIQHPKKIVGGIVVDAAYHSMMGMYGYISGNMTTCLYNYPGVYSVVNVYLRANSVPQ